MWASLHIALGTIAYLTATSAYGLVGGAPSNGHSSVFIWTTRNYELSETYCTASKVSETLFVTAAHCTLESVAFDSFSNRRTWMPSTDFFSGQKLRLSFAPLIRPHAQYEQLTVRRIHFPKTLADSLTACFAFGSRTPNPDIALVEVEPPARNHSFRKAKAVTVSVRRIPDGTPIVLYGYGHQGDEKINAAIRLKSGPNQAYSVENLAAFFEDTPFLRDGPPPWNSQFGAPGNRADKRYASLGSGDSGGPVFDLKSGELVGIASDGYCPVYQETCQTASNSLFVRLDDAAEGTPGRWIKQKQETSKSLY